MTKVNSGNYKIEGIHYETGKPVIMEINDGIIADINETGVTKAGTRNLFVAPGLIDNQINGYAGVDFSGKNLSVENIIDSTKAIWKDGVTSFLPTLITNSHENLIRNFRVLNDAINNDEFLRESVPGFHLEGPYLSTEPGFYGCHPVYHLRKPSWNEFAEYQKAAGGKIIQVTISPELEGAMEFIRLCKQDGVFIAIGHTNASAEQINLAVENGATLSTHLGNGCANLINRHKNPLWPQLANELLTPTLIADGHHLLPEEIQVFYKVKGPDNIILTSDVNHLIGMPSGKYIYMGSEVIYTDDGLVKNAELNCLAGAASPLKKGVETMMNYTGCSLTKAINMAARNVACIYSLNDRGNLAPGKRADLILFERDGNLIKIKTTILSGMIVYQEENDQE
jgi:N-acetylglucosamine-6-phosphate deacetylase